MNKVKVIVPGAGSFEVISDYPPKFIYKIISEHLSIILKLDINLAKRGAPKKVKPVIYEGAAG